MRARKRSAAAWRRAAGRRRATAPTEDHGPVGNLGVDQSLGGEPGVGVADGVEVEAPLARGVAEGGEDGAGLECAGSDAVAQRLGELVVEGDGAVGVELELH